MLAVLALLACVTLPALANSRTRSERASCISNLRQIGQAFNTWEASHGDRTPWFTPWQEEGVYVAYGSTPLPPWYGLQNIAWFQYSWVSNELVLPKYLACPSDSSKVVASNWGTDPAGGFRHSNFQNKSISYTISLHPKEPGSILAGDRDFGYDYLSDTCSAGLAPVRTIQPWQTMTAWQGTLHEGNGNLLFYDGSVEQVDTAAFRKVLLRNGNDNGTEHYLYPQ